jgi:D-glycero-alpha-D-manno-heptose-7-phosphate kinase
VRRPRRILASAPSRIDLAGGTLDIWPISVLVPRAVTVNVAVDLRASATVESRRGRTVRIVSADRRRSVVRSLPLSVTRADGALSLLERLVASFAPAAGLRIETRATAPAGAGLGGSSTLAVAAAAALARWHGVRLGHERLLRRVLNLEAIELGVPTGEQDYRAALHGGLAAYHYGPDGTRRERLAVPAGFAGRLVLAYTGQPRRSGISNWAMFRRFLERDRRAVRSMEQIAAIASEMVDALRAADVDAVGRLLGEEGRIRSRLAPGVMTPALVAAGRAARHAGALGVKVCGAGGGGCLVALAAEGRAARVARAIEAAGARVLDAPLARRGLVVTTV